jgi:hypothetical protein
MLEQESSLFLPPLYAPKTFGILEYIFLYRCIARNCKDANLNCQFPFILHVKVTFGIPFLISSVQS